MGDDPLFFGEGNSFGQVVEMIPCLLSLNKETCRLNDVLHTHVLKVMARNSKLAKWLENSSHLSCLYAILAGCSVKGLGPIGKRDVWTLHEPNRGLWGQRLDLDLKEPGGKSLIFTHACNYVMSVVVWYGALPCDVM